MSSRAKSWTLFGTLTVALIGGSLATLSAVANRKDPSALEPTRASLIDAVLCVVAPDGAPASFYTEMASAHARMHRAMDDVAPSGDPDRDFARSMIPHHQGAVDIAMIQLKYGRDERLRRLAQAIVVEQGQEVAYLRTLLDQPPTTGPDRLTRP